MAKNKFKDKESIEKSKILSCTKQIHSYFQKYGCKNVSQEFRLKNIEETKNYFIKEKTKMSR